MRLGNDGEARRSGMEADDGTVFLPVQARTMLTSAHPRAPDSWAPTQLN